MNLEAALKWADNFGPWPGYPPGGDPEALAALATEVRAYAAERERWREAASFAAHQLEKARIWGGTEWTYGPLHPLHYRSALERLHDVLRA